MIRIETAMIRQETLRARNLEEAMEQCERSAGWTYTVAWIDCLARGKDLGRSLVYRGEHATRHEVPAATLTHKTAKVRRIPFDFPQFALNSLAVRSFNALYFHRGSVGSAYIGYDTYFYPLDAVLDWNRIYGRSGFTQYQCVLPKVDSRIAIQAILTRVANAGHGSFLAVLKLFGPEGDGFLSFPLEGYTLALDFPVDTATLSLLIELDAIVANHGGRLYLAKDARTGAAMLRRGYPKLDEFREVRGVVDPDRKFASVQSERLAL